MRVTRAVFPLVLLLLAAGCDAGETGTDGVDPAAERLGGNGFVPDLAATAENVVVRSAQVKEGDLVLITGSVRDAQLLENLAIEVQKVGGDARIVLEGDRMARRSYDEVPAQYDAVESEWARLLNDNIDVLISVDASESPNALDGVPPERMQARVAANAALANLTRSRNVRTVEVGNGLYPTDARAEQYGISRDDLATQFWNAVNADPAQLAETGRRLRDVLAAAREVRVTHPNGTDITFAPDTRGVFVNAGAITPDDVTAGGAALWKYLPAGEVFARVRQGSANGRLVIDEFQYQGTRVTGLTIDVANGSITAINATSGGDALLAAYRSAAGDGRELLGIFDVGINPALSATPGSRILTWVPAGMVTLVFGTDVWADGSINSPFSITPFLPGSTVTVDGRAVVENGALRL